MGACKLSPDQYHSRFKKQGTNKPFRSLAHSLAFGMMWTIIPHVAIVTNLVLGCKNSFFLYSTVSKSTIFNDTFDMGDESETTEIDKSPHRGLYSVWHILYPPCQMTDIKSAWVWNRGHIKRNWMIRYTQHYPNIRSSVEREVLSNSLKSIFFSVLIPTALLIVTPAFLGGMIR